MPYETTSITDEQDSSQRDAAMGRAMRLYAQLHLSPEEPREVAGSARPNAGLLTAKEAATYVRCHPNTIYDAVKAGRLRCRRVGRLVRFDRADLDAWTRGEQ